MAIFSWLRRKNDDNNRTVENNEDNVAENAANSANTVNNGDNQSPEELYAALTTPTAPTSLTELSTATPTKRWQLLANLKRGLQRTRANLATGLGRIFLGKKVIDAELLTEIETQLLTADIGVEVTQKIIKNLTAQVARRELNDAQILFTELQRLLREIIAPYAIPLNIPDKAISNQATLALTIAPLTTALASAIATPITTTAAIQKTTAQPYVILLVGVNGSGKTTTIGKLAQKLQANDKSVLLAAGDTFRAAAIDQLKVWGDRNDVAVIAQQPGADSAAVIYDALKAAQARKIDVVIADTAGRLHTQNHLMEELKKIKRTLQKIDVTAPHEVLLVLDATIGQNAINQAQQFHAAIGVTGLCITKLDGTAKGGIIFAIAEKMRLPIRFIGVGESIDDLKPFDAQEFVEAIFSGNNNEQQ